jgi:hypothetical protein
MAMQLRKAAREQAKIRLGYSGPSGAGKTLSALLTAYGIIGDWDKIALIDTENRSADLYSDFQVPGTRFVIGQFQKLDIDAPYSPERFIEAIHTCEDAGMKVIIIDSISHEWEGKGGCLEIQEKLGGKYQNWAEVTPRHRAFINAILESPCHIITCARSKTDYAMVVENGKTKVEKQGLKDITREGFDYELTADLDLDLAHNARASKDRTGLFMGQPPFTPGPETGKAILAWCEKGVAPAPQTESLKDRMTRLDKELAETLTASIGAVAAFSEEDKEAARAVRKTITKVDEDNAARLSELVRTYKSKLEALRMAWEAAGSPIPRPAKLVPAREASEEEPGLGLEESA